MANLEVQIGADNSELNKKIKEAELNLKELSKIKLEQIKLGLDTKEITGNIKSVKQELTSLKTVAKDSGNAIGGMAPKVASGSNALMQFSRIAQDAPYGIIGIGNNITATVESFGHLKNSTGSAGGALKAMASSLMGAGGILLGVSLLTTGLTLLSQSGMSVGDIIDKVTGNFNEFGEAIKKASDEGVKATAGEVFGLKALVSAAQNKALSDKDRLIAVENLQKQYPAYFGNLSKEEIMTSNLTGVVKELTSALINRAIAEKLAGASAEIQLGIYQKNAQLVKQKNITSALELKLENDLAAAKKSNSNSAAQLAIITAKGTNAINDSKEAENEFRNEILKGTKAIEQRQNVINQLTASSIKLQQSSGSGKAAKTPNITPQVSGVESQLISVGLVVSPIDTTPITTAFKGIKQVVQTESIATMEAMYAFSESANQLVAGAITDTFMSLGTMIGNSLAGADGGLEDAGKNILGILGGFLTQFGQLMIETGIGLIIAKKMITSGNGYAMVAGGIALVAIGSAFAASSKKAQKSGGDSFGGGTSTSTGSGANNSSSTGSSFSGGSSFGNSTVVFEIAGTSLIGVLNNTTARNLRIGGRN